MESDLPFSLWDASHTLIRHVPARSGSDRDLCPAVQCEGRSEGVMCSQSAPTLHWRWGKSGLIALRVLRALKRCFITLSLFLFRSDFQTHICIGNNKPEKQFALSHKRVLGYAKRALRLGERGGSVSLLSNTGLGGRGANIYACRAVALMVFGQLPWQHWTRLTLDRKADWLKGKGHGMWKTRIYIRYLSKRKYFKYEFANIRFSLIFSLFSVTYLEIFSLAQGPWTGYSGKVQLHNTLCLLTHVCKSWAWSWRDSFAYIPCARSCITNS